MTSRRATALLAALILAAGPLAAGAGAYTMGPYEEADAAFGGSAMKLGDAGLPPPTLPSTAAPTAEVAGFWEKLRTGTVEPACRKVEAKFNKGMQIPKAATGIEGNIKRAIRKFPDGKLALIDEVGLKLTTGLGKQLVSLPQVEGFGLGVGVSGSLEGKSQVVQPIEAKKYCGELLEIAKLWEFKTVVPATAKRAKKMEVGEIWKLPMAMTMSFSVSASANIEQVVTVALSYGHTRQTKPSVTLRRLAEDKLRLRLRLDRLRVNSLGASAQMVQFPLDAFGLEGAGKMTADLLSQATPKAARKFVTPELFDKALLKEINKIIEFKLSFGHSRYSGKKLLLEYVLDPNNDKHMEKLDEFLKGDFTMLTEFAKLGIKFNQIQADDDAEKGLTALEDLAGGVGDESDEVNTFAGSDVYSGRSNSFGAVVPIAGNHNVSWGKSYHRYQSSSYNGETIHVYQRTKSYSGSNLNVPFMGTVFKHNSQRDVLVLNRENTQGEVTDPVLLYQQMDGRVMGGKHSPDKMIETANGMLRYVGVNGGPVSTANQVPLADVTANSRFYTSGMVSVKMLIDKGGVQDIVNAPAVDVMKAFMNVMREAYADILDKVMHLFYVNKKGEVAYNKTAAAAILELTPEDLDDAMNPLNIIDELVYDATLFIKDLVSVRAETDQKKRSERLAEVAGGKGKNGLKYEDFFKVVLQLVKPEAVTAQVFVTMNPKKKGEADIVKNYTFFNGAEGRGYDNEMTNVTQMRERFADPTDLSD